MSADPRHQRSDDELRRALADAPAPGTLDAGEVIRRARHRRRLSTVATTGVAALAVVAIVGIGATALDWMPRPSSDSTVAADSARDGEEAGSMEEQFSAEADGSTLTAPASPHPCGLPPSAPGPGDSDLALTASFEPRAGGGTAILEGVVTLLNAGDSDIYAEVLGQPIVALARDGVTVSRTEGEPGTGTIAVTLAPGESLDIDATLAAVACATGVTSGSPAGSPLTAGDYDIAAAVLVSQDGAEAIEIVGSGGQPVTLE
jgi:hypothetical protein